MSDAFQRIYDNGTAGECVFVSRADNSGTHTKELSFWSKVGLNASTFSTDWYKASGLAMGAVLDMCEEMDAYTLTDDSTYYSRVDVNLIPHINITYMGDSALKNQYSVIAVNASMWSHLNNTMALDFVNWMTSQEGQDLIASYVKYGKQLFFPSAPGYSATSLDLRVGIPSMLQIALETYEVH
jgi:tungstate transport system substrate-binding protein